MLGLAAVDMVPEAACTQAKRYLAANDIEVLAAVRNPQTVVIHAVEQYRARPDNADLVELPFLVIPEPVDKRAVPAAAPNGGHIRRGEHPGSDLSRSSSRSGPSRLHLTQIIHGAEK